MSAVLDVPVAIPVGVCWLVDEPLRRHTAWRTGGNCAAFVVVHRAEALADALLVAREQHGNVHILGAGTRTLARDGGTAAAVVRLGTDFSRIEGLRLGAAVAVPALRVAKPALAHLVAAGSVGASVLHDDGWTDVVASVQLFARGRVRDVSLAEARSAKSPVVVAVTLNGHEPAPTPSTIARPAWWKSPRRAALRDLIEASDLAGVRLRDAWLPAVAPELLVNRGNATARDLLLLHQAATERVVEHTGVDLKGNLHFLGRP